MSNYSDERRVLSPVSWPAAPTEMSLTTLRQIEYCPLHWALQHAEYRNIWSGHGYPPRIHIYSVLGIVSHSCIEKVIGALLKAGCSSVDSDGAVEVMRGLGGYTQIIRFHIDAALASLQQNPRAQHTVESLRTSLQSHASDIRTRVQLLLARVRLGDESGTTGVFQAGSSRIEKGPVSAPAICPEVELHARELHWTGRVDLLRLLESSCEIVDFKTGDYNEKHEFQMQVYALLWLRDSQLNPTSRPIDKLTLSYIKGDHEVPAPSLDSLAALETELLARTRKCMEALMVSPPSARPSAEGCAFCGVRHLCDEYWSKKLNDRATHKRKYPVADVEATLTQQHGPSSWNVMVNSGLGLNINAEALLRVPPDHFVAQMGVPRDRLRILDAWVTMEADSSDSIVLTSNRMSEVYSL